MSNPNSTFRTVMRGYDPAEVDAHIATLKEHAKSLRNQIAEVEDQLKAVTEPNFKHLGDRVGQILSLADEEAAALRKKASKEADRQRTDAADAARRTRKEADEYAAATRAEAEAEAASIVEQAKAEAAAIREAQAQETAEFEQELARRREEAEAAQVEAERINRERIEQAQREAEAIVTEAKETAERIRQDSEREIAELERRRDGINAQLANVRQALAALTGDAEQQLAESADRT